MLAWMSSNCTRLAPFVSTSLFIVNKVLKCLDASDLMSVSYRVMPLICYGTSRKLNKMSTTVAIIDTNVIYSCVDIKTNFTKESKFDDDIFQSILSLVNEIFAAVYATFSAERLKI